MKLILPAVLFFVLLLLLYSVFKGLFAPDGIEPFFVPFAFWIFVQRIVIQIMYEKSSRLQESMRMMGLSDVAYWSSYFISDGIITGFILSFICTIITTGGLFNNANFGEILGLLFVFCLSAVPFAFFLCSFFDTPQTSGQATLAILLGFFVVYIVVFTVKTYSGSYESAQTVCCFFPPLALQIASGAFQNSYNGISTSTIGGIMFADIFIYSFLAWYFSQVWPSAVGVPKPFYFIVLPSYWFPQLTEAKTLDASSSGGGVSPLQLNLVESGKAGGTAPIPIEEPNESVLGKPTVVVNSLRKTYGGQVAVNDLSFKMYENQIFALLGHNGAGKTTTISMLTGLTSPDMFLGENRGASVYGHNILTDMDQVRYSMGVCPQHDVLFEKLTVREHILFFAQLKGVSYEEANEEAIALATLFHLDQRMDHLGQELSGGQKRKLSVAIAVCGKSKFIVLDEPTAGMDPLARRELWDLLAKLRVGRTLLLTTHYMDEADILGDRVGIMSLGQMQCMGTTQFLKSTYGAGYKLIFDKVPGMSSDQLNSLTTFVQSCVPSAKYIEEDGSENQVLYVLPFDSVHLFGPFFNKLEASNALDQFGVSNFGVNITSLEDVFLKVGEDHTVTPNLEAQNFGIGSRSYEVNFFSQVIGVAARKLTYASNDFITIPLIMLPVAAIVAGAALYSTQVISPLNLVNDLVIGGIYVGGYLGAPGLIAEFIVRERNDKLRNVLTVMGCDFRAYWLGTFMADYLLMLIPTIIMWITWGAANMTDFSQGMNGLNFFIFLLFNVHLVAFSYFFSYIFATPKSCISLMPVIIIILGITPNIVLLIMIEIVQALGTTIAQNVQGGILLWGIMMLSPHGAMYCSLLNTTQNFSAFLSNFPPVGACIAFMIAETIGFMGYCYYVDTQSVNPIPALEDPTFDPSVLDNLDDDVKAERVRTANSSGDEPLKIDRLRKVFPPKVVGRKAVVATEDVSFVVEKGEIFGLLGANGAGKTTTLSMLTRHLVPTSGNAFITSCSILQEFSEGATHLGVVTQNNSLWDKLSVESHLLLFARLRGVPEDLVKQVVDGTIDQLELTPHRKKLSMRLSGGMKRKLCVAIALIGDPEVVLLDEPSAGLDPVSRRNLWSVILRTMSQRAVILTTHSMDEAEALCKRIGIMVKGQLRALGTKQHLKNKFGSGYELVIKVKVVDMSKQAVEITNFVNSMFPAATLISENGGLFTFRIPKQDAHMGLAFSQLETNKTTLNIEDYSLAQPTLEQVFIRTVNDYTVTAEGTGPTTVGGGVKDAIERLSAIGLEDETAGPADEVVLEKNSCGCTDYCLKIMTGVAAVFFVLFIIISIAVGRTSPGGSSACIVFAIISLITSITGCFLLYCAACRPPKGADE
mmetsp:Transcript_26129/g.35915  ORF Transcript_26129/g.35915 Transcript_26129/m.35915 type:complete len:1375 (+) Transcript_26129:1-4125(+)